MMQNETDRQTILLLLLCTLLTAHSIRILMFMRASSVPINYEHWDCTALHCTVLYTVWCAVIWTGCKVSPPLQWVQKFFP